MKESFISVRKRIFMTLCYSVSLAIKKLTNALFITREKAFTSHLPPLKVSSSPTSFPAVRTSEVGACPDAEGGFR